MQYACSFLMSELAFIMGGKYMFQKSKAKIIIYYYIFLCVALNGLFYYYSLGRGSIINLSKNKL
jgi:hypothetical protein